MSLFAPHRRRRRLRLLVDRNAPADRFRLADRRPHAAACAVGLLSAGAATMAGGPVAGAAAALYGALAALAVLRRRQKRGAGEATSRALDAVAVLAADLRAGVAPDGALGAALPALAASDVAPVARLVERVASAWEVAEAAGAPLADLLDRLEADARWLDRIRGHATAEAAGAMATAWLLAALPLAGIAVGYGMGADPVRILLHTRVGGACAALALLLQMAGLAWSARLARGIGSGDVAFARRASRRSVRPGSARSGGGGSVSRGSARSVSGGSVSGGSVPVGAGSGSGGSGGGRDRRSRPPATADRARRGLPPTAARWGAAALGAVATALLVGGWAGALVATGVLVVAERALRRMEPAGRRAERLRAEADLPFTADLLAAALRAGLPTDRAVSVVADAVDGPMAQRLARVGRSLGLGLTPTQAWLPMADLSAGARMAAAVARSAESGSALAAAFVRLADDQRARRAADAEAMARRAGVLIVLPLGLCFLPAFVFAGIVPVIVAVLGDALRN